ncbi:MAG: O-antigen translocase [Prevotellaceae bacterium]|jgi:O-antigen/teichoic acid export membrane protein|nr:O-antigen translocase [Prevotellaceae bacterium]
MSNKNSSYRQIFKATSLFGGVQIVNILISVIRSKFVALLLGPAGMGVVGLLTVATGLVTSLTNFGLRTSAVKNVAAADAQHDRHRISVVVTTLIRMVWLTGLLGMLVTLIFAPLLSELTFGNKDYTYAFMFLSVTLLFLQLSAGQNVILQGTRKLKYLANANVLGALLGLIVTVPLYYLFGVKGIVPALIITSIVTLVLSWYFSRKVLVDKIKLSFKEIWKEGKDMLKMGFMLSLSGIITLVVAYLTKIYIGRIGGVDEVGLYNSGFAIIGTYVGLIFTAMSADYYPRLSGVAHDNQLAKETINQQAEVAILILAPILMVFFVFIYWIIVILYSSRFTPINEMVQWAALGMFFRAASWAISFLYLAKSASKLFFINELLANIYILIFNVVGYKFWGLDGLGIAFLLTYIIYLIQVFIICNRKYAFNYDKEFVKIFILQLLCGVACFCAVKFISNPYQYVVGSVLIIASSVYSFKELDKRLGLKNVILKFRK